MAEVGVAVAVAAVWLFDCLFVLEIQPLFVRQVLPHLNSPLWQEQVSPRWRHFFEPAACISEADFYSGSHRAYCFL